MPGFSMKNMCLDSAMDNLPAYTLLKNRKIRAFIDLNSNLNDYGLHRMVLHGKPRYSFMTTIIAICIHLDARFKKRQNAE